MDDNVSENTNDAEPNGPGGAVKINVGNSRARNESASYDTPKSISGYSGSVPRSYGTPVSRYNSLDDRTLRDHPHHHNDDHNDSDTNSNSNDRYWSAGYKADNLGRCDSIDSNRSNHSDYNRTTEKDRLYRSDSADHDQIDRLSIDSRLEQSLGHNLMTQQVRDDFLDVGYLSAPEGRSRLVPPFPKRRSRGRSRSGSQRLLYYNARSRSVSRTRTAIYDLPKIKSLENIAYRRRVEEKREEDLPESEDEEEARPRNLKNATFRQKVTLACLALADFNSFMCLALMAPFFPQEAEQNNVTSSQTGWIFGVFALVQCVTSPLFGKLLPYFGPRFTFLAGNFFAGGCTILFGMLEYFPNDTTLYLVFAFLIRICLALGCTAISCSIFALATSTFPDNPSTVLGLLESAIGVGLTAGPALGGVLYEALGFKGPFFVVGGFIFLTIPVFLCILDVSSSVSDSDTSIGEEEDGQGIFRRLLSCPTVLLTLLSAFVSSVNWIIFDPILEPHMRQFNLSSSALGGVFLLLSATYAILAPFVGKIADGMDNSTPVMMVGHLVGCGAMLLLGPSPLIGLGGVNKLWLNLVALSLMGVSVSLSVVPTYDKILDAADKANIRECFKLHGAIGGLWTSIYALGEFVGPTLAGWALSVTTFDWFLTYTAAGSLGTAIIILFLWIYEHFKWKESLESSTKESCSSKANENTPLLS